LKFNRLVKRLSLPLFLLTVLLLLSQLAHAQLVPGFNVNGLAVNEGDTIYVCRGNSLNYTSTATGFTSISWRFHLGAPATSAIPVPPAIVYNTNGIDSTIQIITDAVSADTFYVIIKVTDVKPVVDFTNNSNVCSGTVIQFNSTVTSGTPPYTYSWVFGDGGTSTLANPAHTFVSLGCGTANYNNTLTVTDATGCSSTIVTHGLNILRAPDVGLQDQDPISPFSNCENNPSTGNPNFLLTLNNFSPSAACITSYTIDWGDGTAIQTGITNASFPINHTYTQIGSFNLVVTALGSNGCSNSKTYQVGNQSNPGGSFGIFASGSTTNLCAPAVIGFTIDDWWDNSAGTTYLINFGDGTPPITLTQPLKATNTKDTIYHTYTTSSCPTLRYTATLSITNSCGTTPFTNSAVGIIIKPTASFTVATTPACVGQSVCFTNTSLGGFGFNCSTTTGYTWDFGDGSPVTSGFNSCHTYTTAGIYTVTLAGTNSCGTSTTTRLVCITGPPTPAFTLNTATGCIPLAVTVTNTTTDPAICGNATYLWAVTYTAGFCGTAAAWNFTNGTTATSISPSFIFNNPGTYNIRLTVTNPCGTFTTNQNIIVKKPPTVTVNSIPNACGTVTVTPSAIIAACSPNAVSYAWTFQGGVPATANTLNPGPVIFTGAGSHTVSLAVTNECGTITNNTQFTIDTVSTAVAGPNQELCGTTVTMAAIAPAIGIGTWTRISGPNIPVITTPGSPNTTITGMVAGTYVFRWTIVNGTCTSTADVTIIISAGPTIAAAGPNQNLCLSTSVTLTGNTALIGTGVWAYVSGPPGYTITNPAGPSTTVTGLVPGIYVFSWTISFSNCTPSTSNVTVTVFDSPTLSNAGPDQTLCAATLVTLAGNTPALGTGLWSYVSGPGGSVITSPALPNTTVTGLVPGGTYKFKWTISNGSCSSDSIVTITNSFGPTPSIAGPAQNLCAATSVTLAGNTALLGTGAWSYVSGPPGAVITDPSLPATTVTGLVAGVYVFQWTISYSNCTPSNSTVSVTIYDNPTPSIAGNDQVICAATTTLTGNIPVTGTGQWSYVSGPAGYTITTPLSATTTVTGLVPGTYTFKWRISNGTCPPSDDIVEVVVSQLATIAAAGPDQNLCAATSATLAGNTAVVGTGVWTFISGPPGYTITNPTAPSTTVIGLLTGTYIFSWTITNSVCPPTTDNVQVRVYDSLINQVNAAVTTICSGQPITIVGATPTGGNGTYTYQWEQSADGINWITITGATLPDYSATLITSTYFRRNVTSLPCSKYSNVIYITVQAAVANNAISADQTICINTAAAIITGSAPAGGNGVYAFQWQQSIDGGANWTNIPGAVTSNYNPGVLTQTTLFRRTVSTALCSGPQANNSLPVTITVKNDTRALYNAGTLVSCAPFDLFTVINVTPFPDRNGLYSWYADGVFIGSNSTGIFPGFTMSAPGDTVIIKLVTTSPFGCKADSISMQFVTVTTAIAQFNRTPGAGCGPLTVNFNNTSNLLTGIQFFWNFGNGITSTLAHPGPIIFNTSPYFNDTTYYVTLKAYNGCDTTAWRDSIAIRADAKSRFGIDTTFGCSPFNAHITNTSLGGPSTYYWDFGNGATDTTYALSDFYVPYNVGITDTFTIRLIAENECRRDTSYLTLVVAPNIMHPQISVSGNQLFGCVPHAVIFNNNSSGATNFTWNFGDGSPLVSTSAQQSAVPHTYLTPGIFPVSVRLQNGCSDSTIYLQVEVFAKPVADFTSNGTVFCAGDTVRLTNNSQNANAWRWNFGDGNTSSLQNPTHVYATGGTYSITLQADKVIPQGIVCTDSKQTSITVTSKPPANIVSNSTGLHCIPYTLTASALGLGNETATWYITDTTVTPSLIIISGINAQYTYLKPGTFSAKLVVVNSAGCKDSSIITFIVNNKPISAFSPLSVSTCKNDTTILHINNTTYTGIDPLQYRWYVDNQLVASTVNLTHQYLLGAASLPNTFNTWLISSNTLGCSDTARGTVIMQQPPKGIFNFTNQSTCVPFNLQVNNTSTGATSYRWLLNGTTVSTAASPVFAITQPATLYTITLISNNIYGCKPDTITRTFVTLPRPKAIFTVSDTLSCTGSLNIATNNQTTGANNYTWIWSDGSPNSNFANPTHLYTAAGSFPVILIAGDGACRDTTSINVKIANKPIVNFSADKTSTCGAATVSFTNLTTLATSYLWDFGDGTLSNQVNPVKTFAARATAYNIKLVATGTFGCKDSLTKPNFILAKLLPATGFVVSPGNVIAIPNYSFNFINTTPQNNSYSYFWNFGDNSIPAATRDATHRYQDTGKYLVKLAVFDNVSNCTDTVFQFVQITGFPGYLYVPNAFQPGSLQPILKTFLPIGTGLATYRLQVFTTWGQKVFESTSLDAKGAPNQGWNGLYNGKDNFNQGSALQQDTYIWRIDAVFKNGTEWKGMSYPNQPQEKRVGTVTIIR